MSSEELSRAFYAELGADGLARRTRPDWDEQIVASLVELLPPGARVLDVGCGYGRIALPLAGAGFDVCGIDLSPDLLAAARRSAGDADVELTEGSMTSLPYGDESFDAVLCLWSAFHELLLEEEQVRTLRELYRVLRRDGFALLEGPLYEEPTEEELETGARRGPDGRIAWLQIEGILNPHYQHDERSYARLCEAAGITSYDVFERDWAGRRRLFLRFER